MCVDLALIFRIRFFPRLTRGGKDHHGAGGHVPKSLAQRGEENKNQHGRKIDRPVPERIKGLHDVRELAAGDGFSLALEASVP